MSIASEFMAAAFFLSVIGQLICFAFAITADGKERVEYLGWWAVCFIVMVACVSNIVLER